MLSMVEDWKCDLRDGPTQMLIFEVESLRTSQFASTKFVMREVEGGHCNLNGLVKYEKGGLS